MTFFFEKKLRQRNIIQINNIFWVGTIRFVQRSADPG